MVFSYGFLGNLEVIEVFLWTMNGFSLIFSPALVPDHFQEMFFCFFSLLSFFIKLLNTDLSHSSLKDTNFIGMDHWCVLKNCIYSFVAA